MKLHHIRKLSSLLMLSALLLTSCAGAAPTVSRLPLKVEFAFWWGDFTLLVAKDRKSTRLNSSHIQKSRMPSSA